MRLLDRLPKRVIQPDCPDGKIGKPLMTRYKLLRTKPLAIFLHHFHRSDLDEFHDHPWSFVTFLLSSGYWEHTPKGRFWRKRFSILYRPAEWQHFIEISRPTWTLVIRFREKREWGFYQRRNLDLVAPVRGFEVTQYMRRRTGGEAVSRP